MSQPREYNSTWFDRNGPEAGARLRRYSFGAIVTAITIFGGVFAGIPTSAGVLVVAALIFGVVASAFTSFLSHAAGATYAQLMINGSSTPYKEQYSYQQTLVMQGRVDEALESFEAVIAENPGTLDARVKAAELYARDKKNAARAAELFREIQRLPMVTPGEYSYATNRLCDLLTGPLDNRGRALVELRRLIETYPGTTAAEHARTALAALKPLHHTADGDLRDVH